MNASKNRYLLFALLFTVILVCDQWTKITVAQAMELGRSIPVIGSFFHITYVHNYGGAFSIFMNQRWLFIVMGMLVPVLLVLMLRKLIFTRTIYTVTSALILSGAVGNLIDRLRFGYVIDFIQLGAWPVFNIADIAITCGIACLIVMLLKEDLKNKGNCNAQNNVSNR